MSVSLGQSTIGSSLLDGVSVAHVNGSSTVSDLTTPETERHHTASTTSSRSGSPDGTTRRSSRLADKGVKKIEQEKRDEERKRFQKLKEEEKARVVLVYPFEDSVKARISITMGDLERLPPGEFLNDNIIDFFFK